MVFPFGPVVDTHGIRGRGGVEGGFCCLSSFPSIPTILVGVRGLLGGGLLVSEMGSFTGMASSCFLGLIRALIKTGLSVAISASC